MKFDSIIHTEELLNILDQKNLVIVDVRSNLNDTEWGRSEHQKSHIPRAQYTHLDDDLSSEIISGVTGRHPWPSDEQIESLFSKMGITDQSQIVVYDQHHGGIAARFWATCLYAGIENAAVLNGGWKAWTEAGRIVSSENTKPIASEFSMQTPMINIVEVDELKNHECIIDARGAKRYRGEEEPIDPIAGHIPGAMSLPFLDNLNSDYKWKTKEEISSRFKNIPTDKSVIYCGSGVTACHNLLALKYTGFPLPNIYAGSWSHYITDPNRKVMTKTS